MQKAKKIQIAPKGMIWMMAMPRAPFSEKKLGVLLEYKKVDNRDQRVK